MLARNAFYRFPLPQPDKAHLTAVASDAARTPNNMACNRRHAGVPAPCRQAEA